jgi:outer membrane protein TolC
LGTRLDLTYTLLDFGQTRATTESARQALLYADFTHNRQIQTILQQVTSDYYNYLSQQELQNAHEADLFTAQTTFKAVEEELCAGTKDNPIFCKPKLSCSKLKSSSSIKTNCD